MTTKSTDFAQAVRQLDEINKWFQNEDIDLDEGLKKLREGKELIKSCRERLQQVENEFLKIKDEFTEPAEPTAPPSKSEDIPF